MQGNVGFDFLSFAFLLLESGLSLTFGDIKLLDEQELVLEFGLKSLELGLLSLESLLLL